MEESTSNLYIISDGEASWIPQSTEHVCETSSVVLTVPSLHLQENCRSSGQHTQTPSPKP